jgi:hypothetical protein
MDREYTSDKVEDKLTRRIQASSIAGRFRRHAALMKGNARWELSAAQSRVFCPAKAFRRRGPNETPSMTLVSARGRHRHGSRRHASLNRIVVERSLAESVAYGARAL